MGAAPALAPVKRTTLAMRRQRVLDLVASDQHDRPLRPPIKGMIEATRDVLPKIERIESEWSLLLICRTVGLYLSPPSSLNPQRVFWIRS